MTTAADAPKRGFVAGQGYLREVAAYHLDYKGFAGVPETIMYTMPGRLMGRRNDVRGSLQRFVPHDLQSWDTPPGKFSAEGARKIAIFDLRMLNCDRHGGNILVDLSDTAKPTSLIPIDHGYILPSTSIEELDFEWMLWPQSKTHFTQQEKRYIASLPTDSSTILATLGIPPTSILYHQFATIALQRGASLGLTPYQIGTYFRREELCIPSMLEDAISVALGRPGGPDFSLFRRMVDKQMKLLIP
eukprot:TRINITY_DN4554_c0_g1_i2.p1 TRINITY_DN4554_c0_g1~~TRINITY_DN4554_c0_g1_i2.p1  ORF type:complete len:245 (+),score=34.51 TRINITY_DN4554_c0_g1_i2:487-1221(+)